MEKTILLRYSQRSTLPAKLAQKAQELDITVEQLCKRFISAGMAPFEPEGEAILGETLDDFLVKNGVLTPAEPGDEIESLENVLMEHLKT